MHSYNEEQRFLCFLWLWCQTKEIEEEGALSRISSYEIYAVKDMK